MTICMCYIRLFFFVTLVVVGGLGRASDDLSNTLAWRPVPGTSYYYHAVRVDPRLPDMKLHFLLGISVIEKSGDGALLEVRNLGSFVTADTLGNAYVAHHVLERLMGGMVRRYWIDDFGAFQEIDDYESFLSSKVRRAELIYNTNCDGSCSEEDAAVLQRILNTSTDSVMEDTLLLGVGFDFADILLLHQPYGLTYIEGHNDGLIVTPGGEYGYGEDSVISGELGQDDSLTISYRNKSPLERSLYQSDGESGRYMGLPDAWRDSLARSEVNATIDIDAKTGEVVRAQQLVKVPHAGGFVGSALIIERTTLDGVLSFKKKMKSDMRYECAIALKKKSEKTLDVCEKAARQGDPDFMLMLSFMYLEDRFRDEERYRYWISKAAKKSPEAQAFLGLDTAYGRYGFRKNERKGIRMLENAASQGFAPALRFMASIYFQYDSDLERDKAVGLLMEAVDLGDGFSAYSLARRYIKGDGVQRNPQKGFSFLNKYYQGEHDAEKLEALLLELKDAPELDTDALIAESERSPLAALLVAERLVSGDLVARDLEEAFVFQSIAVERGGFIRAHYLRALHYLDRGDYQKAALDLMHVLEGKGEKYAAADWLNNTIDHLDGQYQAAALRALMSAAEAGHGMSEIILAERFAEGDVVERDVERAWEIMERRANEGWFRANNWLGNAYLYGHYTRPRNYYRSRDAHERVVQSNVDTSYRYDSSATLALLLLDGLGGDVDIERAASLFDYYFSRYWSDYYAGHYAYALLELGDYQRAADIEKRMGNDESEGLRKMLAKVYADRRDAKGLRDILNRSGAGFGYYKAELFSIENPSDIEQYARLLIKADQQVEDYSARSKLAQWLPSCLPLPGDYIQAQSRLLWLYRNGYQDAKKYLDFGQRVLSKNQLAEVERRAKTMREEDGAHGDPLSLDFSAIELDQFVELLSGLIARKIRIDNDVSKDTIISILVKDVPWARLLSRVAEEHGLSVQCDDEGYRISKGSGAEMPGFILDVADGEYNGSVDVRGQPHGSGTIVYPSGARFEGVFSHGIKQGHGKFYDSEGRIRFDANWHHNNPRGYARLYKPEQSVPFFEGFIHDARHATGTLDWRSSYFRFHGDVINGYPDGIGYQCSYRTGVDYCAQWQNGKLQSEGYCQVPVPDNWVPCEVISE